MIFLEIVYGRHVIIWVWRFPATSQQVRPDRYFQLTGSWVKNTPGILQSVLPWFDSTYIESYLDTLEILLYSYEFEEAEFDSYYEDVLDVLGETPYDSIISLQRPCFCSRDLRK